MIKCMRVNKGSDRIRLGIIGCGAITENSHLPAALSSSMVDVTALCDTNESRLRFLERQFGLQSIGFLDYRDTFARVDAVILALPNHLHASVGCEFLLRGIHVLCEKPLALTRSECEELCRTSQNTGAVLATGYVTRFFPSTDLTKELIESDFLGLLTSFDYEFGTEEGWAPLSGYNLMRSTSGGGVLVVSGSHFIDRMLFLFGDTKLTNYADDSRGGVEANCVVMVNSNVRGNSIRGCITLSKTHNLNNRLRVSGSKGILEIREGQKLSVTYFPAHSRLRHEIYYAGTVPSAIDEDYFRVQLEDFILAILMKSEPRINREQGSVSVTFMEECYKIARSLDEPWVDSTLQHFKTVLQPDCHS